MIVDNEMQSNNVKRPKYTPLSLKITIWRKHICIYHKETECERVPFAKIQPMAHLNR